MKKVIVIAMLFGILIQSCLDDTETINAQEEDGMLLYDSQEVQKSLEYCKNALK